MSEESSESASSIEEAAGTVTEVASRPSGELTPLPLTASAVGTSEGDRPSSLWTDPSLGVALQDVDPLRLRPGVFVGDYCIDGELGAGSSGLVYSAVHPVIGKRCAVKVLAGGKQPRAAIERFIQEARAVNEINHPGVVNVFAYGVLDDGRPYLIMERLDGEPLDRWISRTSRPFDVCVEIAVQISAALSAAHSRGVIHRDLKPANIFLCEEAGGIRVKLLDFGLAKLREDSGLKMTDTASGAFLGTPAYVSPEQALGRDIDGRSDVYSLGVILFEFFTGKRPFLADTAMGVAMAQVSHPIPDPRSVNPELSPALGGLVCELLAKSPDARPTLDHVIELLQNERARAVSSGGGRRLRWLYVACAAIAVGVVGALVVTGNGEGGEPTVPVDTPVLPVVTPAATPPPTTPPPTTPSPVVSVPVVEEAKPAAPVTPSKPKPTAKERRIPRRAKKKPAKKAGDNDRMDVLRSGRGANSRMPVGGN